MSLACLERLEKDLKMVDESKSYVRVWLYTHDKLSTRINLIFLAYHWKKEEHCVQKRASIRYNKLELPKNP
jgi:hypothetical protein